ncbi:MAG: hypothetical protein WA192_16175 [Candidatus Acidiferrales bacterium]
MTILLQPTAATVTLGQTLQFQAAVIGSTNTAVTWEVDGVVGGISASGTVSAAGLYTAPLTMPSSANVTVTAVSQANAHDRASASVVLQDGGTIAVSPASATVAPGGAQVFSAANSGGGNLTGGIAWSVNGVAGGNATVGTIAANGASTAVYTAPATIPSPALVSVAAASTADPAETGSATVTIACGSANAISPASAQVGLGQAQAFSAFFCGAGSGTAAWDVNGISGGNPALGTITSTGPSTASYASPGDLPATNPVTIHASEGGATAAASVTVVSNVMVSISPAAAGILLGERVTLTPRVTNTPDGAVTWSVSGISNGNAAVGQICQEGSNPCQAPIAASAASVDYLAPASAPGANPVLVTATSAADPGKSATAAISVSAASTTVAVTISPAYAFIGPSSGELAVTQQFSAAVTGATNTGVSWSVQSGAAGTGEGCAGLACGTIDSTGLYHAPMAAPSPNAVTVTATSQADASKSASAMVAITSGPTIETILPSSVFAGAVESFALAVQGSGFVAGNGSSASTILINGGARGTTCATAAACATAINPADVASAVTLTIQVQNPGPNGALSNPVPFVIIPFDPSVAALALTAAEPTAASLLLVVPEPTTAAESAPVNVDTIGLLTGGNNCGVQGSPLTVPRPATGSAVVSLCVHGNGLDPTFLYSFSGAGGAPDGSDIGVTASAITGLFPNMIELDLQISSATLPGVRTLFITTLNNDRAAATGMLDLR